MLVILKQRKMIRELKKKIKSIEKIHLADSIGKQIKFTIYLISLKIKKWRKK